MLANKFLKFIKTDLSSIILENEQFKDQKLHAWEVKESSNDFGFMSTIMDGKLTTQDINNK